MIPVSDSIRARTFPFVNISLITTSAVLFLVELSMAPPDLERFILDWGVRPTLVSEALRDPGASETQVWLSLFTAMFLHGGLLHLAGNMLFLWVFGDNVEDRLGHITYLVFYLATGLVASFTQIAIDPNSSVPTIGASGAISGVLGGYLVLYPGARVRVIIPIYFIPFGAYVSAGFLLLIWFGLQLLSGAVAIGDVEAAEQGVAWFAHIGGFAAGVLLLLAMKMAGASEQR